jgi:hypothetical protein
MMIIARAIAFVLLLIAAIAFLRDLLNWYDSGALALLSGDQLWLSLSPAGYQSAQNWAGDHLPLFSKPIMATILALPVFLSAGVLGALLLVVSRSKHQHRRSSRNWRGVYG